MKPRVVIVGSGQTGRELASQLASNWQVSLVDVDPVRLERLSHESAELAVETFEGDGSSTLVLKRAGIESASAVISLTRNDSLNLEVSKLALKMFEVKKVLAVVNDRQNLADFEKAGVVAICKALSVAASLHARLESGRRSTNEVGLGRGEILEVSVLAHSAVVGKTLSTLHPHSWLVGAIYRQGELVVPHGATVIEAGDKVLLVGDPHILSSIADYFHSGMSEFPLQYGSRILCTADSESAVREAAYLAHNTRATELMVTALAGRDTAQMAELLAEVDGDYSVVEPPRDTSGWMRLEAETVDVGCRIVAPPQRGFWASMLGKNGTFAEQLNRSRYPCLISRGTYPYRRILLAVSDGPGSLRASELAIDVARLLGAPLTALVAVPPAIVTGEERQQELREALARTVDLAELYSLKIEARVIEGNPVVVVAEAARETDLLVTAHRKQRRFRPAAPDVSWHLLTRPTCSTLVFPFGDEDLA